jgi:hypothetical protein
MQLDIPLTPALSPSDGEREKMAASVERSHDSEPAGRDDIYSLAPSDGERVRVRGSFN